MEEETSNNNSSSAPDLPTVTGRLAEATQSLAQALQAMDAQFQSLHAKIDRIVAAVEDGALANDQPDADASEQEISAAAAKVADLEKKSHALKAQAELARRKTLSPLVTSLLAKEGLGGEALIEAPLIDKALATLSIDQRIAVKAELARAGILL